MHYEYQGEYENLINISNGTNRGGTERKCKIGSRREAGRNKESINVPS
jgi:hypothetical protein